MWLWVTVTQVLLLSVMLLSNIWLLGMKSSWHYTGFFTKFLQVKTGPFHEHSNQLWNISGVQLWSKVNTGLIKMYKNEVKCIGIQWNYILSNDVHFYIVASKKNESAYKIIWLSNDQHFLHCYMKKYKSVKNLIYRIF